MRIFLTFALLLIATTASAFNWEYVGMDGVNATTLTIDTEHNRILVGTLEGFWYYDQTSGLWTERVMEGSIGRSVWAIDYNDTLPEFVATGRENSWFKGYLEYSEDLGATENLAYESSGGRVTDMIHKGQTYWACTSSDVVDGEFLRSNNGGTTWAPVAGHGFHSMTDLTLNFGVGDLVLAGDAGVKLSYDLGDTWLDISSDLPGNTVHCVEGVSPGGHSFPEFSLYVSTDLGLYYSGSEGHWFQSLDASCRDLARINDSFASSGDGLGALTWDGRVMVLNRGWTDETGNLPGTPVAIAYTLYDHGLYVVTAANGVWRRTNLVVSVDSPERTALALSAYPNPFNPITTLHFALAEAGETSLRVYDLMGREVAILAVGPHEAGEYTVNWHPTGFPSGTYIACLKTKGVRMTQKLVLLK